MIEHNKGEGLTFRGQVLVELFPHDWNTAQLNELGVSLLEYMADNLSSFQPVRDAFKERAVEIDIEPLLMEMVKVAADFMDKSEMTAKMIQKAKNEKKKQIESEAYQAGVKAFEDESDSGPPLHFDSGQREHFERGYNAALKSAKEEGGE